jgi:hypothetical protein
MSDTVTVTLAHPHAGKAPGEKLDLPPAEAKLLIRQGKAVPATVPEAKKLGEDPATAASQQGKS